MQALKCIYSNSTKSGKKLWFLMKLLEILSFCSCASLIFTCEEHFCLFFVGCYFSPPGGDSSDIQSLWDYKEKILHRVCSSETRFNHLPFKATWSIYGRFKWFIFLHSKSNIALINRIYLHLHSPQFIHLRKYL